jgi:hypothetical protein
MVYYENSSVIPGHQFLARDRLVQVGIDRETPPACCDFPSEHVVADKGEELGLPKFPKEVLVRRGQMS